MLTTISPHFYLGIDAGGTHTEAVMTDETGFILGRSLLHYGTNPHNNSLSMTYKVLAKAVSAAREDMRYNHPDRDSDHDFDMICVGMAGYDTEGDRRMVTEFVTTLPEGDNVFKRGKIVVVNNGLIGLKSGTEKSYGICLSVGTGSNCYGLARNGKEAQAGGWGYLLGDQGSGYAIGRAILRQVMREFDGRQTKTELSRKLLNLLGLHTSDELISWTYSKELVPVSDIAKISVLVNDPELGDCVELESIVTKSAIEVINAYSSVVSRLGFKSQPALPVVLTGGVFEIHGGRYTQRVIRSIKNITPEAVISSSSRTPAEGAISLALAAQGTDILPGSAFVLVNPPTVSKNYN